MVGVALASVTALELPQADHRKWFFYPAVAIVAVGAVIDPLWRAFASEFLQIPSAVRLKVEQPVMALIDAIDQEPSTGLTFRDVGVTVFVVRKRPTHLWHGVQVRIARMRFKATPRPTVIRWTRSKGILGACWEHRSVQGLAHRRAFGGYRGYSRREWKRVDPSVRRNLTLSDVKAIADYGYVEAHPMIDDGGRYRGCLVVQVEERFEAALKQPELRDLVDIAAANVCSALGA